MRDADLAYNLIAIDTCLHLAKEVAFEEYREAKQLGDQEEADAALNRLHGVLAEAKVLTEQIAKLMAAKWN